MYYDDWGLPRYLNSVKGHNEEQLIVGNFIGDGIDTIFIASEIDQYRLSKAQKKKYVFGLVGGGNVDEDNISYAVSNNHKLT